MTCNRVAKRQQIHDNYSTMEDAVLYHDNIAVFKVQNGTTFGLAKMLYKSTRCNGRIIGLRPRQESGNLVCIITQDQTILTDKEYDIILYENEPLAHVKSYQDKSVNTLLTFNPQSDNQAITMSPIVNTCSIQHGENTTTDHTKHCQSLPVNQEENLKVTPVYPTQHTYMVKLNWNRRRSVSGHHHEVINCDSDDQCILDSEMTSKTSSTSPDTDNLNSCPPSQIYQSPFKMHDQGDDGTRTSVTHGGPKGNPRTKGRKKKWQCLYCEKSFTCRSALENHQRTHTGERPFQCADCGRSFTHHGNLKQHLHIHRDRKPYECDICGKGYTRSNRLRDHRQLHDTYNGCNVCTSTKVVEWSSSVALPGP